MNIATLWQLLSLALLAALCGAAVCLFLLLVRALKHYLNGRPAREEQAQTARSLGEVLKAHRMQCRMTQEFVAEAVGVSRQAVSKWESGAACPSTANLVALARLYGVPPESLLKEAR
ncbi:MAG: helix-turn-helix domain-containing protein, partial [Gemmiger sp.]